MRHRLKLGSTVYFHDHLMTARIEGREGGREGGEGVLLCLFFHAYKSEFLRLFLHLLILCMCKNVGIRKLKKEGDRLC